MVIIVQNDECIIWVYCGVQLGLHVFFGCYHNLFRLMAKCGVLENLLVKEHTHTFVNAGTTKKWPRWRRPHSVPSSTLR